MAPRGATGLTWRYVRAANDAASATREIADSTREQVQAALVAAMANALAKGALVPTVHSWMTQIIPQIGEADATIVGLFLELDRHRARDPEGGESQASGPR